MLKDLRLDSLEDGHDESSVSCERLNSREGLILGIDLGQFLFCILLDRDVHSRWLISFVHLRRNKRDRGSESGFTITFLDSIKKEICVVDKKRLDT
jgi:hypothetical protein